MAFLVGFLALGFGLLPLLLRPKDVSGDEIGVAAMALGVGLMVWGRLEQLRIRPMSKELQDLGLAERLARTVGFTPQILASNRRGRLSTGQRLRLLGFDVGWWLSVLVCLGVIAVPFVALGGHDPVKDVQALVLALLVLYALWQASSTLIDALRGRVRADLTTLHVVVQPGNWASDLIGKWYDSTAHYAYEGNDGTRFVVSRATFEALAAGRKYTVYFAPLSKRLMSIEPAGDLETQP